MPVGRTLSKEVVGEATTLFKDLGLSQESAQKLIDFATKNQISTESAGQSAYNAMREGWRNDALKDQTIATGNDLKPEVKESIGRAIDSLPADLGKDLRQILDVTGLGDNPTFVKSMYELSKFVVEGRPVQGRGPSTAGQKSPDAAPKSIASAMFPSLK